MKHSETIDNTFFVSSFVAVTCGPITWTCPGLVRLPNLCGKAPASSNDRAAHSDGNCAPKRTGYAYYIYIYTMVYGNKKRHVCLKMGAW